MPKIGVLRDIKARKGVAANEIARRAYLYVARNQTLPPQVRYQAQLQLNTFGRYTRPTTVKNRCTESGRGRGIMSEFGLCRVCVSGSLCSLRALALTWYFAVLVPVQAESLGRSNPRSAESLLVIKPAYTTPSIHYEHNNINNIPCVVRNHHLHNCRSFFQRKHGHPLLWGYCSRCMFSRLGKIRNPEFWVAPFSSPTVNHFNGLCVNKQTA